MLPKTLLQKARASALLMLNAMLPKARPVEHFHEPEKGLQYTVILIDGGRFLRLEILEGHLKGRTATVANFPFSEQCYKISAYK
jgi:hypothetical protein|tara:strand:- start:28867 stop:29118 length:252 start_codon:yes stop_codon:yes gene_type:complete